MAANTFLCISCGELFPTRPSYEGHRCGDSTLTPTKPLILMAKDRATAEKYNRTDGEERQTLFECEICKVWFLDMVTFANHLCSTTSDHSNDSNSSSHSSSSSASASSSSASASPSASAFSASASRSSVSADSTPSFEPSSDLQGNTSAIWTRATTLLLIAEYKKLVPMATSGKIRKKTLWAKISEAFSEKGYSITSAQCEGRWKTLTRGLKNVHDHNNKSGNSAKTHPYATELAFISEKPNFSPVYVVASTEVPKVDGSPSTEVPKVDRSPEHDALASQDVDDEDDDIVTVSNEPHAKSKAIVESRSKPCTSEPKAKKRRSNSSEVVNVLSDFITTQQAKYDAECTRRERMHSERMEIFRGFLSVMQASARNSSHGNFQGQGSSTITSNPGVHVMQGDMASRQDVSRHHSLH